MGRNGSCSLRVWSNVIGIFSLVSSALILHHALHSIFGLSSFQLFYANLGEFYYKILQYHLGNALPIFPIFLAYVLIAVAIFHGVNIFFSAFVLIAAWKKSKPGFLVPWLVMGTLLVSFLLTMLVYMGVVVVMKTPSYWAIVAILTVSFIVVMQSFFLVVIFNYYRQLKNGKDHDLFKSHSLHQFQTIYTV